MHEREFRVLDGDDAPIVDRLAAAVGRDAARILAYLLLRAEREDAPATNLHIQVGTQLNRTAVSDAVGELESADLVERTSLADAGRGRPPTAWRPVDDLESTARRAYDRHAEALIEHAGDCHGRAACPDEGVAGSAEGFTVALNWAPNGLHAPLYAAMSADWYDEFDVDVRVAHHDGSRRAVERVGSGAADVGLAGAATVVRARMAGEPIVPVAVLYQRSMTVLYTVREVFGEPLRSVEQLRGRRVGMPPRSETRVLGQLLLSRTVEDDVRIVDTNGEERDALLRGEADVVTGSVTDPERFERRDMTADALLVTDHFPVYGPTVVARGDVLTDRTATLRAFLAGTTAGWTAARSDPTAAAERIAEADDCSPASVRRTFERAAEEFGESDAVRDRGWGWQRDRTWDRLRTALQQRELLGECL
jgi:ABC-type nitrate/sulfonate/bicarbonate transport system substrate-binding protein/predicted transcriptional regulator